MKLILANNQSERFKAFYSDLKVKSSLDFDYCSYRDLLFIFPGDKQSQADIINLNNSRHLKDYDSIYINGYLNTYELAASVAVIAKYHNINFVNQEFNNPPSLSKISMHAKLASQKVGTPSSVGGTKEAILKAKQHIANSLKFPVVLKRADADRGIDNFKIIDINKLITVLEDQPINSIWIVQEYLENDGYFLISFYGDKAKFSIYRDLKKRPDGNSLKAHMYKPKGGVNASLIDISNLPKTVLSEAQAAIKAMNRQIASVDIIYNETNQKAYILEVNYNPQLVTIETFKDTRIKAFKDYLEESS